MRPFIATGLAFLTTGCVTIPVDNAGLIGRGEVEPVVTEHSLALQCLGGLLEEARVSSVIVHVDRIRDRTIPTRLNDETRLSQAGEWLVHTAIAKLETARVRSTLNASERELRQPGRMKISGAWTQDDQVLRRQAGDISGRFGKFRFGLGANRTRNFVAGDFTTSVGGVVVFASAIGVVLSSSGAGASLRVDDGADNAEIELEAGWADGPMLAQRRIAEAAVMVHIARYYKIDYVACLESGWGQPAAFRKSLRDYAGMSSRERRAAFQTALTELGYAPGATDGAWGVNSREALMAFQADKALPSTGQPSAVVYAIIAAEITRSAERASA